MQNLQIDIQYELKFSTRDPWVSACVCGLHKRIILNKIKFKYLEESSGHWILKYFNSFRKMKFFIKLKAIGL